LHMQAWESDVTFLYTAFQDAVYFHAYYSLIHTNTHIRVFNLNCVCVYIYIYIYTHTHTHTHTHIHTHA
jgi:hypothetical protein